MTYRFAIMLGIIGLLGLNVNGDNSSVKVGANAPAFTVQDQEGRNVTLRDSIGKIVVLEWYDPECEYTKRDIAAVTSKTLSEKYKDKGVVWLAVNSTRDGSGERNKAWIAQNRWSFNVLHDANQAVAKAFGVNSVPYFVIIDKNGGIAYLGVGDNDDSRDGGKKEGKINYIDKALEEMIAGKPVSLRDARAYGCPLR